MPITLTDFFHQANNVGGGAQASQEIYLRGDDQLASSSAFYRICFIARRRENASTVQAFMTALQNEPAYREHINLVANMFSLRVRGNAPLTTKEIVTAKALLDKSRGEANLQHNVGIGQVIARTGAPPPGAGASFGQFCHAAGLTLQNENDERIPQLLKDYFKSELIPEKIHQACTQHGLTNKQTHAMITLLQKTVVDEPLAVAIDNKQLTEISYSDVLQSTKNKVLQTLDLLVGNASVNVEQLLATENNHLLANTLLEAVQGGSVRSEDLKALQMGIAIEQWPIETAADKSSAIRSFQMNTQGVELMKTLLESKQLPTNLAEALAHHPALLADARGRLDAAVPPPALPTVAQAEEALRGAMVDFLESRKTDIDKFVKMAQNPPVDLSAFGRTGNEKPEDLEKKKLSLDTLPKFINALLDEQKLLNTLLSDAPVDDNLLEDLVRQANAAYSCTHGVQGNFDLDEVQKGAARLLLVESNLVFDHHLVGKIVAKWGAAGSDLLSAASLLANDELRGRGGAGMQGICLEAYQVLQSHLLATLDLVPKNTLENMGIPGATPEARVDNLITMHFKSDVKYYELSQAFRDFASKHGLLMAPITPEQVATNTNMSVVAGQRAQEVVLTKVLSEFSFSSPDAGIKFNAPEGFHEFFNTVDQRLGLRARGIDSHRIDDVMLVWFAERSCKKWLKEHPGTVVFEEARALVKQSLENSFKEIADLVDAVDAWPGPDSPDGFSVAEKNVAKEVIMASELRDISLLRGIVTCGRRAKGIIGKMAEPPISVDSLARIAVPDLWELNKSIEQLGKAHPKAEMLSGLRWALYSGLNLLEAPAANRQALHKALQGEIGQRLATTFNHGALRYGGRRDKQIQASAMGTLAHTVIGTLSNLREFLAVSFNAEMDSSNPLSSSGINGHDSAISLECMESMNRIVPGTFSYLEKMLAQHTPHLDKASWDIVGPIIGQLVDGTDAGHKNDMVDFMRGSVQALLTAQRAVKDGRPLTRAEIWKVVTGKNAQQEFGPTQTMFGLRLYIFMYTTYESALHSAYPQLDEQDLDLIANRALKSGVTFPKALELLKPSKTLHLKDIAKDMSLPSISANDLLTQLVQDNYKRGLHSTMTFNRKNGQSFVTGPDPAIPRAQCNPGHPHFATMLAMANEISLSEEQKFKILQCFTNSALDNMRSCKDVFPRHYISPTSPNVTVTATQQKDDSVVVELRTTELERLRATQRFVIQPDGSHTCTAFRMERNRG